MDFLLYPVTTQNPEAQKYFNQGLLLSYSFNHAEAARSFYHATRLDSTCAMCYWGYAFVLGPNYNSGMDPDHYERAYDAIQKAVKWSAAATPKEKAMIKAMTARYNKEVVEDRSQLDSAFMVAMKGLHAQFPDDVNIAAIYAESLMDMHPWDLWEKDGTAKPWTPEILRAIENAIALDPKHPGGHHYYIHAVEASNEPERALPSCKVFDDGLVANAGHLVHMPSHIYINTGDYHLGTIANIKAVQIDSQYVTQCHADPRHGQRLEWPGPGCLYLCQGDHRIQDPGRSFGKGRDQGGSFPAHGAAFDTQAGFRTGESSGVRRGL
jgi:hypothetical protein